MIKRIALICFALTALTINTATAAEPSQLVDLKKVFTSAPIIYSLLSLMSIGSLAVFLYSLASFRTKDILAEDFLLELKDCLKAARFADAEALCADKKSMFGAIISAGLKARG